MSEKIKPNIRGTRIVANSNLFNVEQVDLLFSNGEERIFERIRSTRGRGTVMMVPLANDNDTIFLVREYGVGTERYEIGLPKGVLEKEEDIFDAANRELQEEIGMGAKQLDFLKPMTTAPGYQSGVIHTILARNLYPAKLEGDEPEPIEVFPWKLSQLEDLLAREDFTEARSIAALFLTREFLNHTNK